MEVKALKTAKSNLPQSLFMENKIIGKFPSMTLIIGRSGSGKSTVCNHICTHPDIYGGFFDYVFLFSPTGNIDDLPKHLKLPEGNIITDKGEFISKLEEIIQAQENKIKGVGIEKAVETNKVLIILDDIVSSTEFMKSPALLKLATMGRHSLISSIINTQSYTKIVRGVRLQANSVILFPSNQGEIDLLVDDHTPPHTSKKAFRRLVEFATAKPYSFLHIMCSEPANTRFRRNLSDIINVES